MGDGVLYSLRWEESLGMEPILEALLHGGGKFPRPTAIYGDTCPWPAAVCRSGGTGKGST